MNTDINYIEETKKIFSENSKINKYLKNNHYISYADRHQEYNFINFIYLFNTFMCFRIVNSRDDVHHLYVWNIEIPFSIMDSKYFSFLLLSTPIKVYLQKSNFIFGTDINQKYEQKNNIDFIYLNLKYICDNKNSKNIFKFFISEDDPIFYHLSFVDNQEFFILLKEKYLDFENRRINTRNKINNLFIHNFKPVNDIITPDLILYKFWDSIDKYTIKFYPGYMQIKFSDETNILANSFMFNIFGYYKILPATYLEDIIIDNSDPVYPNVTTFPKMFDYFTEIRIPITNFKQIIYIKTVVHLYCDITTFHMEFLGDLQNFTNHYKDDKYYILKGFEFNLYRKSMFKYNNIPYYINQDNVDSLILSDGEEEDDEENNNNRKKRNSNYHIIDENNKKQKLNNTQQQQQQQEPPPPVVEPSAVPINSREYISVDDFNLPPRIDSSINDFIYGDIVYNIPKASEKPNENLGLRNETKVSTTRRSTRLINKKKIDYSQFLN